MVIKDGSNIDFAEYPANFEVRCRISSEDISYFICLKQTITVRYILTLLNIGTYHFWLL